MSTPSSKETILNIFLEGISSVKPKNLFQNKLKWDNTILAVCDKIYDLSKYANIYVIGAGKASAYMALEVENILGEFISDGHIITKYNHGCHLQYITITEAAHPIPDENGLAGTQKIIDIAQKANENDLVICLISGGASALMIDTPSDLSLDDLRVVNELLINSGATITEINTVRKHLSEVKGGQLANLIYPASCLSLILSDVVGDPVDVIASGPTAPDSSDFNEATRILKHYGLYKQIPESVKHHLLLGMADVIRDTPDEFHPCFKNTHNHLIGNNLVALESATIYAKSLGFDTHIITDSLEQDYKAVADFIVETIGQYVENRKNSKPICLLFGGEPTVKINGKGLGGRNQHLALYLATKISDTQNVIILCAGSDGTDGPTDVAGAIIDSSTCNNAALQRVDIKGFLDNFDSFHFFEKVGGHVYTGPTQTNVMDIIVVLIK